jgi:hypothetical protein
MVTTNLLKKKYLPFDPKRGHYGRFFEYMKTSAKKYATHARYGIHGKYATHALSA